MRFSFHRRVALALLMLLSLGMTGCGRSPVASDAERTTPPVATALAMPVPVVALSVPLATPPDVLQKIQAWGGTYRLDPHGRVTILSFGRCPLKDGDLEIVRSTPDVVSLNLRGMNDKGGTITVEGLEPLVALRNLRRLDLSYNHLFTGRLEVVEKLSRLEFLDLVMTQLGDEAIEAVAQLRHLKTLRVDERMTERGLKMLRGSSLETLDYWFASNEDVGLLGGLKKLKTWRTGYDEVPVSRLNEFADVDQLEGIPITVFKSEGSAESIAALRSMKGLQVVEVSGRAESDWSILAALDSLPHLKSLRLLGIGDEGLKQLPRIPTVETLDLSLSTVYTEEGLKSLAQLPALRHLSLRPDITTCEHLVEVAECSQLETLAFYPIQDFVRSISGEFNPKVSFKAADLRPILQRTALKRLSLGGMGFGDELMREVSVARHLEVLTAGRSPITDAGLERLRELKHLKDLDLTGTQITYDAAQAFQRDYAPQCTISDNWCCGCMTLSPLSK